MPSLVRSIAAAILMSGACGLVAAADTPPPAASAPASTTGTAGASPGSPSILVVFDIDMEVSTEQAAPEVTRQARDAARREAFEAIGARLKAWGLHEGVGIDTALFSQGRKIDMADRKPSHLLVEKITQAAVDNNAPGGPRIDTRKWKATAYDTSNPSVKQPRTLGTEEFISDGPACFTSPPQAADDDCRADYLRRLTSHLRWIDLRWSQVAPAPR